MRFDPTYPNEDQGRTIAEACLLRAELELERRYSRGLRDTLRQISRLNPVTGDDVMEIIREGVPDANEQALDYQKARAAMASGAFLAEADTARGALTELLAALDRSIWQQRYADALRFMLGLSPRGLGADDGFTVVETAGGGEIRRNGDQITITPTAEVEDA